MDDFLLGLFAVGGSSGLFGLLVFFFAVYERKRRKPDETDTAGAEEGDARNPNQGDVR
jgi:uncharacterized membrane protein